MKKFWEYFGKFGLIVTIFPEPVVAIPLWLRLVLLVFSSLLLLFVTPLFSLIIKKITYFWACRERIKIGICIENDEQSDEIAKYCNKKIRGISTKIKFEVQKIKNNDFKKHGKLVRNSDFDLIVWTTSNPNAKGKISLNFTYKNTADNLIAKIIHSELSSMVSIEKMFDFNKETIKLELNLERDNIANFSLFIVSICASVFRGSNAGIPIFEKLYEELANKSTVLAKAVSNKLASLYLVTGANLLRRKKYQASLVMLEKGYALSKEDADMLCSLALSRFHNGDINGAELITTELLQNHTGFPIAHLDGAFFRVRNKNYKSALKHYLIFARTKPDRRVCIDAIEFMYEQLDKDPNELGYLFAIGFLKRLLNKNKPELTEVGENNYVKDFEVFIKKADKNAYKEMIEVATKFLNSLNHLKSKYH